MPVPYATFREGVDTLFLDLDDTVWENNIYFLQTLAWLCQVGRRAGLTDRATRRILDSREERNIPRLGYSYGSYEHSFLEALAIVVRIGGLEGEGAGLRARAKRWTHFLRTHPIVLLEGVGEALPRLRRDFRVVAVTKGNHHDQMSKVHRSGLLDHFHDVQVVPRKNTGDYRRVLERHGLSPDRAVMIGNAPRSDINGAKRAGLRTIYVPHPSTWHHEIEPIANDGPETLVARDFHDVLEIFGL